jgi:hypothetical protein
MTSRRLLAAAALVSCALVLSPIGCGGDDPASAGPADGGEEATSIAPSPDGGDAASNADAGDPAEGGPILPPSTAATYRDQDPRPGFTTGTVRFVDEATDVVSYALSWVTESGADKGPFVTVPFAGPTHHDVALTTPPVDATYFHIVASTKASTTRDLGYLRADNFASSYDVGLAAGKDLTGTVSAVVDTASSKLVVLFQNPSSGLTLRRCALDGTGCTSADVVPGRAWPTVLNPFDDSPPRLVIDTASSKLVFAMPSSELGDPPLLARCNLDTTGCVVTPLVTAPQLALVRPQIFVDSARGKLVLAGRSGYSTVAVFVCALDGTACSGRSLGLSYAYPGAFGYDTLRGQLVMAAKTSVGDFVTYPTMFTFCDVADNACTSVTRTPPEIANDLGLGRLLYDAANDRLLVIAGGKIARCLPDASTCTSSVVGGPTHDAILANGGLVIASGHDLYLCAVDGSGCTKKPGAAGGPSVGEATVLADATSAYVVSRTASAWGTLFLDRCNVDGSGCAGKTLEQPAAARAGTGASPFIAHNAKKGYVFLASNGIYGSSPAFLTRCAETGISCTALTLPLSDWTGLRGAFFDVGLDKLVVAGPDYSVVCDGGGASCTKVVGLTGVVHDEATHTLVDIKGGAVQRCPIAGGACTSQGSIGDASYSAAVGVDPVDGSLVAGAGNFSPSTVLSRCKGGTCVAGASLPLAKPRTILVDPKDQSVLVFGDNTGSLIDHESSWFVRCAKDLVTCSAGAYAPTATAISDQKGSPSGGFDGTDGALYLFVPQEGPEVLPALHRCARDLTGCVSYDLAQGRTRFLGNQLLVEGGHVLGVATDLQNDQRARFMRIDAW